MSHTIFSKSAAFPVAIGGSKIVKTFPSGLVLVSQEYAVPRGQEATYASTFAVGQPLSVDSPAIDGLYIFPEPEWRDSGDGFTRLTVSAYGRWNVEGHKTFSKNLGAFVAEYRKTDARPPSTPVAFTESVPTINDNLVWQFVLPKASSPNVAISDTLRVYRLTGQNADPVYLSEFFDRTGYNTANPTIISSQVVGLDVSKNLTRAENTNFGAWDEWTVVWAATPAATVNLGSFYKILPPVGGSLLRDLAIGPINGGLLDGFGTNFKLENDAYNSGNAFFVNVDKVESLHTTWGSFSSSMVRTNIPVNTSSTTFRGGNLIWQPDGSFQYTAPPVTRPSGIPSYNQTYTSNSFIWNTTPVNAQNFRWAFEISFENFVFTFKNELNQTSEGVLYIRFNDPANPALTQ